jgi:hypothetical protein
MISLFALNGTRPPLEIGKACQSRVADDDAKSFGMRLVPKVLRNTAVALVLLALPAAAVKAQEPEQWPQDDDYAGQAPVAGQQPSYDQPQYPQSDPQQGNYAQAYPQPYGAPQPQYMPQQAMNAQQLEQMLAPIALYPDTLIAQMLAASTYPAQVAAADQWVRSMGAAPPEQIAAGANAQPWDPSVKALTAYPQVLAMMNQNLQWTTALGNAYYNQPQDVLETVQVLRQRAQSAGNLQSTPQEQVVADQGYISVAPANPEVVYVPTYNPWAAYGRPIVAYPGYEPLDAVGAVIGATVNFGLQFAVGAFLAPFNLLGWGLDWFGHAILFDHDVWCTHSYEVHDWGFSHGGPRAFGRGEWARGGYGRGGYGRGEYGHGGYGGGYGHNGYGHNGYGNAYGNGGGGNGGLNAYRNQPGFNRGGGNFPIARPAQGFGNRNEGGYNRAGNFPPARPAQGYGGGVNRGSMRFNGGTGRAPLGPGLTHPSMPGQQYAYNHPPAAVGRPIPYHGGPQPANRLQGYGYSSQPNGRGQQFASYGQHPALGSGSYPRPNPGFGGGQSYRMPSQAYRAPSPSFGHGFSRPPANAFAGNSGGFHPFGGGHNSAPSYGGGHSFSGGGGHSLFGGGGGHSFGGGGGHSFFGGGGHSSGGGGHSFGGGGHFGGGHSGGGHSGGGHSGGGHHR